MITTGKRLFANHASMVNNNQMPNDKIRQIVSSFEHYNKITIGKRDENIFFSFKFDIEFEKNKLNYHKSTYTR